MVMLVVDDDPVSRLVIEHVLRSGGHEVRTADDAAQAIDVIGELNGELSVIFCDYHMPDASGLDLLESLRADHVTVPAFVLVTGVGEADELGDDRAGGVAAFLTKPVQSSELLATAGRLAPSATADC